MANTHRMTLPTNAGLIWAELRSTRAKPPRGIKDARHKTYVSALEQAQQLFTAAANAGVATSPLLLFYGLSQGGRAIAAAARHVNNDEYKLTGHGINTPDSKLGSRHIDEVEVHGNKTTKSSFNRLSKILKSPVWDCTAPVSVGELWSTLPEGRKFPLEHLTGAVPLPIDLDQHSMADPTGAKPPVRVIVGGIPADAMPMGPTGDTSDLDDFLARYPTLAGYIDATHRAFDPDRKEGWVFLAYPSSHSDYPERIAEALAHSTTYRMRDQYAFPSVGKNTSSLHPVMTWWCVLFALSMLARYHPETWADHIAIDSSNDAVPIERLLIEALTAVPELLLQTIRDVSR